MMVPKMFHIMALVAMFLGIALAAEESSKTSAARTGAEMASTARGGAEKTMATRSGAEKATSAAGSRATSAVSRTAGSRASRTSGRPASTSALKSAAGHANGEMTLISVSLAAGVVTFGILFS